MAKSEADRYQSKLDSMERSRKPTDPAKKSRNLQKMDTERDAYKKLLAATITAQKETYAKHPIVFKAALTAYWLSHERHVTLLVQSLEHTQTFAKQAEREMLELNISTWTPPRGVNHATYLEHKQSIISDDDKNDEFHSAINVPIEQPNHPAKITVNSPTTDASPNNIASQYPAAEEDAIVESPTSVVNVTTGRGCIVSRKTSNATRPFEELPRTAA